MSANSVCLAYHWRHAHHRFPQSLLSAELHEGAAVGPEQRQGHDRRDGNPNLHYPGDYNVAVRGHRDLAYRQEVLDEHGVTMQVRHADDAGDARRDAGDGGAAGADGQRRVQGGDGERAGRISPRSRRCRSTIRRRR